MAEPTKAAPDLGSLIERIDRLVQARPGQRVFIGIAGAPGSGKSTLAETLVRGLLEHRASWIDQAWFHHRERPTDQQGWIGSHVAHVPMDGFHLADIELERLGRAGRKGAPDTFDPAGYIALLSRLRSATETVWAPAFDRAVEQPIAGAIPVTGSARVIITEGNYLLLDDPEWVSVRKLLDEVWFCDLDPEARLTRLVARHERFGKPAAQALRWATGPDERNAKLVVATRNRADLVLFGGLSGPRQASSASGDR
jgi:pantothenate kinase